MQKLVSLKLKNITDEYILDKPLGDGLNGTVMEARKTSENNKLCAIKI